MEQREQDIRDCNYKDENVPKPGYSSCNPADDWWCSSLAYLLNLLDAERKKNK
jgi:hypothetical protein